jgi:Fic family protein
MFALAGQPGIFRSGGVGIFRGEQLVHMALPADRVPHLMAELLDWLARTEEHPLVASCVFHYTNWNSSIPLPTAMGAWGSCGKP